MPLLQVRNCPEDLYKKLAQTAKQQHRSIAQQTIVLLESTLGKYSSHNERRKELLEKIRQRKVPQSVHNLDSVALIREDRDR